MVGLSEYDEISFKSSFYRSMTVNKGQAAESAMKIVILAEDTSPSPALVIMEPDLEIKRENIYYNN